MSQTHLQGNFVIPNLHVSASGSASDPTGGISVASSGPAHFSDILSVTDSQVAALNAETGLDLKGLYVNLKYRISGSVNASPTNPTSAAFGYAQASFTLQVLNDVLVPGEPTSAGGQAALGPHDNKDSLNNAIFDVTGYLDPNNPLMVLAALDAFGTGTAANGVPNSYNADYSDTAAFEGVTFFADAALTEPLPDIELGSALGFDYLAADATFGAAATPEPSTWVMMAAGFGALGIAAWRRRTQAA